MGGKLCKVYFIICNVIDIIAKLFFRELCCSYLDNWYQPGQIISSFLSSDNCTIVCIMNQFKLILLFKSFV